MVVTKQTQRVQLSQLRETHDTPRCDSKHLLVQNYHLLPQARKSIVWGYVAIPRVLTKANVYSRPRPACKFQRSKNTDSSAANGVFTLKKIVV